MASIESGLIEIHAMQREKSGAVADEISPDPVQAVADRVFARTSAPAPAVVEAASAAPAVADLPPAFALIDEVSAGSPAEQSGLDFVS
jgi:hypothetical protein